jgi:hypothetical protein
VRATASSQPSTVTSEPGTGRRRCAGERRGERQGAIAHDLASRPRRHPPRHAWPWKTAARRRSTAGLPRARCRR